MIILSSLATGIMCLLCFLCGFKCAMDKKMIEDETMKKILHPIETVKEHKEEKEQNEKDKRRREREEIIMDNINNYPYNQQEVPKLDEEDENEEDEF